MIGWEQGAIDSRSLAGKVAVVTGAGGQLGPVWCDTLVEMGADVFKIDLPECDVSRMVDVEAAAYECIKGQGAPSVVVLNAAIDSPPGSVARFHNDVGRIIDVNLIGAMNTVSAFLPAMIENGGGVIVGIVSIMGRVGADYRNYEGAFQKPVAYNLSKAALEQYARSLTVQYGRFGIRACCIGFGAYDGGKLDPVFLEKYLKNVPLGRPVSRASAKAALVFALTCPEFAGQTIMIDGGYLAI